LTKKIKNWTWKRDTIAGEMRAMLDGAAFKHEPFDGVIARRLINHAEAFARGGEQLCRRRRELHKVVCFKKSVRGGDLAPSCADYFDSLSPEPRLPNVIGLVKSP